MRTFFGNRTFLFSGDDINDVYLSIVKNVINGGDEVVVRGKKTLEISPVVIDLNSVQKSRFLILPGRNINYAFAIAEVLWILSGRSDVDYISYFNKNMASYSDNGVEFHGGYGHRIRKWGYMENYSTEELRNKMRKPFRDKIWFDTDLHLQFFTHKHYIDQLECIVEKIQEDINTRQAVCTLWDVRKDNMFYSKDYPCNVAFAVKVRDGKLDMSVFRRSNDVVWGLPYNIVQFSSIQEYLAGWLGVDVGSYVEFVNSMHIYLDEYKGLYSYFTKLVQDTSQLVDLYTMLTTSVSDVVPMTKLQWDRAINYMFNLHKRIVSDNILDISVVSDIAKLKLSEFWELCCLFLVAYYAYRKDDLFVFSKALEIFESKTSFLWMAYEQFKKEKFRQLVRKRLIFRTEPELLGIFDKIAQEVKV